MQFATVEELTHAAIADHEVGEEIAPGVVIERRSILRFGLRLGALAALTGATPLLPLTGCSPRSRKEQGSVETPAAPGITVADFIQQIRPRATELIAASEPNEQLYLQAVVRLLTRITPQETWNTQVPPEAWKSDRFAYYPPVMLFQIRMAPNAVIGLHDHRHYNGVLLSLSGAARTRSFDIVDTDGRCLSVVSGELPAQTDEFLIHQNGDTVLRPGQLSTLSRDRDNIHQVEAGPDGCRLMDFFTYFRPEARSYGLEWDGKPFDMSKHLYKASWSS